MSDTSRESDFASVEKAGDGIAQKLKKFNNAKSPLSTHVLDTSRGVPGNGVPVSLYKDVNGTWILLKESCTEQNGRCSDLITEEGFKSGQYKLRFKVKDYYADLKTETMFPVVDIIFDVKSSGDHYHVPLLLSPYGFTTYRGS